MYRAFVIITIITALLSVGNTSDCMSYTQRALDFLNSLSLDVIKVDNKLNQVCKQFPSVIPTESINERGYRLQYYLPNFSGNFEVKIKHRMLGIKGHDPQTLVCDNTYVDMRALPDYVNGHEATWHFQSGMLTIEIPFRFKRSEVKTYCGFKIDETLIHVRRG